MHLTAGETQRMGCIDSSTPNHVILHSDFEHMLGEFYVRSIIGLFQLLEKQDVSTSEFAETSQLYLHRLDFDKSLMDSHHLFTDVFRSKPLQDVVQLLDNTHCQCLPRVLLCGYQIEPLLVPEQGRNRTYLL